MRTLMDAKDKELEKVFTAEQFKLYCRKKIKCAKMPGKIVNSVPNVSQKKVLS